MDPSRRFGVSWGSPPAWTIFALGGEVFLPTGDETKGLGAQGIKTEAFASFGQVLSEDAFLQAQLGVEVPFYVGAEKEVFGRLLVGGTYTSGAWGRSWTPMAELQVKRDLEDSAPVALDFVPQIQMSLNTRQLVLANVGVLIPATETEDGPCGSSATTVTWPRPPPPWWRRARPRSTEAGHLIC